ncbi:MAG: spermidine/putrescine ABC transporter substrate-binding protein [Anaerolineae bacterium]
MHIRPFRLFPKLFVWMLVISLLVLGTWTVSAQNNFWSCPAEFAGQTLNVYNWTTYIAEDTISNFERMCGVTVVYNTYASDSDMLEELRQGNPGYDIVVPSNSNVSLMLEEGLLQQFGFRFNHSSIPNFDNIAPQFIDPPYDVGNGYTVPYQWGTIGIGYNRTTIGHDITSWEEVFNGTARVAWLDENRAMLGFALLMLGDDPNTSDPAQVDAAAQYLIDHSANVVSIAPDTGQDLLIAGQADIAIEYSGDIFQIIGSCNCDDYRYAIPDEGAQLWTDNLAIPVNAPNRPLAEAFINYILNPQVGADISNYTAYASPNQAAIDQGLINEAYLTNPGIYPPPNVMDNLFYNVSDSTLEQLYSAAWDRVRAAVGR